MYIYNMCRKKKQDTTTNIRNTTAKAELLNDRMIHSFKASILD